MYPLPDDPATDPLIRARAWVFKVLRERPDNAHHIIASVLLGLDRTQAIQIVRELSDDSDWADDLVAVMGEGWAEDILAAPDFAPHVRALDEREADALKRSPELARVCSPKLARAWSAGNALKPLASRSSSLRSSGAAP